MDIKFKKCILLTMQKHGTINRKIMSFSPTKFVGLHMLAPVCIK